MKRTLHVLSHLFLPTKKGGRHCLLKQRKPRLTGINLPTFIWWVATSNPGFLTIRLQDLSGEGWFRWSLSIFQTLGQYYLALQPSDQERQHKARSSYHLRFRWQLSWERWAAGNSSCLSVACGNPGIHWLRGHVSHRATPWPARLWLPCSEGDSSLPATNTSPSWGLEGWGGDRHH